MKKYLSYLAVGFMLISQACFAQMEPPDEPTDEPPDEPEIQMQETNGRQMMMEKGRMRHRGEFGERMSNRANKYIEEMEKYQPGIKSLFEELKAIAEGKQNKRFLRQVFADVPLMYRLAKDNEEIKKSVAESTKLEIESLILANKISTAKENTDVEPLKAEFRQKLITVFEKKQDMRKMRLDHLEKKIQKTREEIKFREENKNKIIDQRYNQLINSDSSMEW